MKKDLADVKKKKKEQKMIEKIEKQKAKEEKKLAREAKKKQKNNEKANKGHRKSKKKDKPEGGNPPQKKGRKAAEKAKAWQKNGKDGEASSSVPHPVRSRKMRRLKKMSSPKKSDETASPLETKGSKKSSYKTEKKTEHKAEETLAMEHATTQDAAMGNVAEQAMPGQEEDLGEKRCDQKQRKVRQTAVKSKAKAKATSKAAAKSKTCKKDMNTTKTKSKGKKEAKDTKEKKSRKRPASGDKKPTQSRLRIPARFKDLPVDSEVKEKVENTLAQCKETHCTHPEYKHEKNTMIEYDYYWDRKACGIKADRRFFTNKKAKGKGKAHVAYFSGTTSCPYSNVTLADLWVSW